MTTKVIHIKNKKYYDNVVLIDRTTDFGNPFIIGVDGSRDEVLEKFSKYFLTNQELQCKVMNELKDKTLACWCKPKKCHGDIYAQFINSKKLLE